MSELRPEQNQALGHTIEYYEIIGEEYDTNKKWVGADLDIRVKDVGQFFLNIVTKAHFQEESIEDAFDDVENPEDLLVEEEKPVRMLPFVVNDKALSDEVLERKFANRLIEEDLATSLWPVKE